MRTKLNREERERLANAAERLSTDDLIEMMKYYKTCEDIVDSIMTEDDEFERLEDICNNYYHIIKIIKNELIRRINEF